MKMKLQNKDMDLIYLRIMQWLFLALAISFFLLLAKNLGWLKI